MAVQAVVRAFNILEVIAAHPAGVGVTAVAAATDLPKSTVSRLLATMAGAGVVDRAPDGVHFTIGATLRSWLSVRTWTDRLIALARPTLEALNETLGEDVGLVVPEGNTALYVDQVSGNPAVQVKNWTGHRFPLHVVAPGKLFLAFAPPDICAAYLARPLEAYTSRTLTDPAALGDALPAIRAAGVSWSTGEFAADVNSVAAPVCGADGRPVAAVNVYGPSYRFPPAGRRPAVESRLRAAARQLSTTIQQQLIPGGDDHVRSVD